MAAVRASDVPQIQGISIQLAETLARINQALDDGDRRAFSKWCIRWRSLSERQTSLLLKIATTEG